MPNTILGNFPDIKCSDCGEIGNVIQKHWGPLTEGEIGYFCNECFIKRRDFFYKNGRAKPLPTETEKELTFNKMNGDERRKKIVEIKKRLEEYEKHKNDPYAYFQGEIVAVNELTYNAPKDIEFLLMEINRLISVLNITLNNY